MKNAARGNGGTTKPAEPTKYTTGEMARLSKNTLRTVRFYEEAGILSPMGRTEGGHRVFEPHQLDRLRLVSDMREAGFSLEQIRALLETKQQAMSGSAAAEQAVIALRGHLEHLRAKVEVLTRLAKDLGDTVASAAACMQCRDAELFPNRCSACARVGPQESLPRGMRVLWSLHGGQVAGGQVHGGRCSEPCANESGEVTVIGSADA